LVFRSSHTLVFPQDFRSTTFTDLALRLYVVEPLPDWAFGGLFGGEVSWAASRDENKILSARQTESVTLPRMWHHSLGNQDFFRGTAGKGLYLETPTGSRVRHFSLNQKYSLIPFWARQEKPITTSPRLRE